MKPHRFLVKTAPPTKSNGSTPIPGETGDQPTIADKLNIADLPKPFKSTTFTSRLPHRTASNTQFVKKTLRQILFLEGERLSGGDGFLTASQTAQRARGEVIEAPGKKKHKPLVGGSGKRGGNLANLKRGRASLEAGTGTVTPSEAESRRTTPDGEDDEDEGMEVDEVLDGTSSSLKKDVITYHTPAAPPSLLPPKKYCDITGLHASYTDPRTKLRYKGLEVWSVVRNLGPGIDQAYLSLRNAQTSLK